MKLLSGHRSWCRRMMVVVGFDRPTIEKAMELVETYDFLYASVGWHPVDAIDMT